MAARGYVWLCVVVLGEVSWVTAVKVCFGKFGFGTLSSVLAGKLGQVMAR